MPDERALQTLFYRYWSPQGWTERPITEAELQHARAAGLMFDDVAWTHDEVIERVMRAATLIDPLHVAQQFAASLSSRRLDLRSALGSYAVGRLMPAHSHTGTGRCPVCGGYGGPLTENLNILSFERHKWGGVRHLNPSYIAFDLERFHAGDYLPFEQEDAILLDQILGLLRTLPPTATPNESAKALAKLFKSNDAERRVLLEILGYCSVLETSAQPGFGSRYIPEAERPPYPPSAKNDWSYPVAWWKGAAGLNEQAVQFFFPFLPQ